MPASATNAKRRWGFIICELAASEQSHRRSRLLVELAPVRFALHAVSAICFLVVVLFLFRPKTAKCQGALLRPDGQNDGRIGPAKVEHAGPKVNAFLTVQEAFRVNRGGEMLLPLIDALRPLCGDFPHSHNLVILGQPPLLQSLALSMNEETRSRVTYSVILPGLSPEAIGAFILGQLERPGLGRNTFTPDALALIVRSSEGLLRQPRIGSS
jgi:hypothetical protein